MTNLYLPGAKLISGRDGGTMLGGPAKVVWHTTENDPTKTSATNVAKYLVGSGDTVHIVWHPITGELVQMIPANRAGRGLENRAGGVETNRAGSVVVQIEVVGRASAPFTNGPMVGLPKIQAWLASLGIPPVWSGTPNRSTTNWAKAGHFGHVDVPEQNHTDPGLIDKTKLIAPLTTKGWDDMATKQEVTDAVWKADIIAAPWSGDPANRTWATASVLSYTGQWALAARNAAQFAARDSAAGLAIIKAMAAKSGLTVAEVEAAAKAGAAAAIQDRIDSATVTLNTK